MQSYGRAEGTACNRKGDIVNTMLIAAAIAVLPQATPRTAPTPAAPSITAPAQAEGGAPQAAKRRYCVMEAVTGSRIPRRTCRTREVWLADGFDPLAPGAD